jgi:hypothetical protein
MLIAPQEEVVQNKTCNNQPCKTARRGTHYNSATNSQERMWLVDEFNKRNKGKIWLER